VVAVVAKPRKAKPNAKPTKSKPAKVRPPAKRLPAKAPAKKAKRARPAKPPPRGWATPTVDAVRTELRKLDKAVPGTSKGAVAATALALAKKLDDPETSASAAATCGRVILGALEDLRALAPPKDEEPDGLDAIRNRHAPGSPAP
jgi:hypothetical protein